MEKADLEVKFYRSPNQGIIGGVCAGLADGYGLNVHATRAVVAGLAFFVPPIVMAYIALIFVLPKKLVRRPSFNRSFPARPLNTIKHHKVDTLPRMSFSQLSWKLDQTNRRLGQLESYLISDKYQLDHQYKELEQQKS